MSRRASCSDALPCVYEGACRIFEYSPPYRHFFLFFSSTTKRSRRRGVSRPTRASYGRKPLRSRRRRRPVLEAFEVEGPAMSRGALGKLAPGDGGWCRGVVAGGAVTAAPGAAPCVSRGSHRLMGPCQQSGCHAQVCLRHGSSACTAPLNWAGDKTADRLNNSVTLHRMSASVTWCLPSSFPWPSKSPATRWVRCTAAGCERS